MNTWIGMGRLTADPDIRYTSGDNSKAVARYRLAVDRRRANADGQREADFINCVAFDQRAEFAERYLHKGSKILVSGEIRTGSYTNRDGVKVYTTEIYVNTQEFAESKASSEASKPAPTPTPTVGYDPLGGDIGEGFESVEDQFNALFNQK